MLAENCAGLVASIVVTDSVAGGSCQCIAMGIIVKCETRRTIFSIMINDLSLLPKSGQIGHRGFGRFRRFRGVDHCLELVVADPPVSILIIVMIILILIILIIVMMTKLMISQPDPRM